MKNEHLIINLIHEDLKHNQLLTAIERIGFDRGNLYNLQLLEIIAKLMKVPKGPISNRWDEIYAGFMLESINYKVTSRGESLRPLAEVCYKQLRTLLDYEKRHSQCMKEP